MTKILIAAPIFPGNIWYYLLETLSQMDVEVEAFDYRAESLGKKYYSNKFTLLDRIARRVNRLFSRQLYNKMNRRFIRQVMTRTPDMVLVIKGELLFPETIRFIREKSPAKLVLWFPDSSTFLGPVSTVPNVTRSLEFYEWVLFCDPKHVPPDLLKQINRYATLTFGCYPNTHRSVTLTPNEQQRFGGDVCFIGNSHFEGSVRYNTIEAILDHGFNLKCCGADWQATPLFKKYPDSFGSPIYGNDMVKAYNASKIALNINGDYPYLNVRNFEAPACGTCTITSMVEGLDEYFSPGQEVVVYTSVSELIDKLEYYLHHDAERASIGLAGQKRAHQDHNLQKRLNELLSIIGA